MAETCKFPNCSRHPGENGFCIGHTGYGAATAKGKKAGKKDDEKTELEQWYAEIMKREKPVCWETGQEISTRKPKTKDEVDEWHGSIAHVLPKKLFKSVKTHPDNYLILKMWGGTHARYDSGWAAASKMKVWPEAVRRFIKIFPSIADSEKKFLPDVLLAELEKHSEK